jgi:hypothetical protein
MTYRTLAEKIAQLTEEQKDAPVKAAVLGDVVSCEFNDLQVMPNVEDRPEHTVVGNPYLFEDEWKEVGNPYIGQDD